MNINFKLFSILTPFGRILYFRHLYLNRTDNHNVITPYGYSIWMEKDPRQEKMKTDYITI